MPRGDCREGRTLDVAGSEVVSRVQEGSEMHALRGGALASRRLARARGDYLPLHDQPVCLRVVGGANRLSMHTSPAP